MLQNTQILKNEITATLDLLPLDTLTLLAEFTAFLRTKVDSARNLAKTSSSLVNTTTHQGIARVMSPRLVHREQLANFQMEVLPEKDNDSV